MIETRALGAQIVDGITVLDVVGDPMGLRLFLGTDTDPRAITAQRDVVPKTVTSVSKALMILADWPGGDRAALPIRDSTVDIAVTAPEPDLFDDMRVLLASRNGETPELVQDWLRYHVENQGADAALVLDRTRPDEAPLAPALDALIDATPIAGLKRLVIVTSPLPLGANAVSERHPLQAPDAPGKDRMEAPQADPWTAPLGQMIVWEALRWRFLARARAIAFLEVSDLLAPAPIGRRAFDLIEGTEAGVVALVGRRIYPWRIRKGHAANFGDHICDQFDNPSGNRRWVAAPARIPDEAPFRLVRVGSQKPAPQDVAFFYRAMGARVSEDAGTPLAPKAGLVVDEDLLTLSRSEFGFDPVLPPVNDAPDAKGLPATVPGRTAIVTCMKNEGPFVLEWIAHHRAIGVDDFIVYSNDCTDGTDTLLDLLQDQGILAHRENPFRDMPDTKPQHAALEAAESEPIMARAAWAVCMDVDEFINIHVGEGTLRDLYAAVGDANMISMTWRLFGNSDLRDFVDMPTPARFDRCAPHLIRKPHQAWGFKTLFRNNGIYRKMGVHRPKGLKPDLWEQISWVNGSGEPMPKQMLRTGWRSSVDTYGYDLVTLNHYAVRDAESFLVKRDRGRVNHVERDQGLGYWFRMNNNSERDTSIRRMLPAMEAEMAALKALPGVAEQHDKCVAAHRVRIAELRGQDEFAAIFAQITSRRMERLSRMHRHFGANVFLAGPDCVPEKVWKVPAYPDDFFFTVGDVDETAH
ncbi:Glycosyl transferase family 2 [Jannaschia faecimaris]|uniref:Glycosyl transferase family 2 n=1 Tax=Jannaschia faecimaris TaxID=1244108 RepID=A0A1H3NQD6_9RHOB|nr:glycosyltransferase family 2 protein [Jannaschia faecimaris]SDY91112.1 Glycosyl transferase family 2 [Jannaschia faecimaris]